MSNSSRRRARYSRDAAGVDGARRSAADRRQALQFLGACLLIGSVFVACGLAYQRFAPPEWADRGAGAAFSDECAMRYRSAMTAADTAIIDRVDVGNWRSHVICGIVRRQADEARAEARAHVHSIPRGLTNR